MKKSGINKRVSFCLTLTKPWKVRFEKCNSIKLFSATSTRGALRNFKFSWVLFFLQFDHGDTSLSFVYLRRLYLLSYGLRITEHCHNLFRKINDKLANYNNGVKFLIVAAYLLRVKTKSPTDKSRSIIRTLYNKTFSWGSMVRQKNRVKEALNIFMISKKYSTHYELYSTHSETKSAFAERIIRSVKNIK